MAIMALIWIAIAVVCFLFSYRVYGENRVENQMRRDIVNFTKQLDNRYYSLIKISQQMTIGGTIGSAFDRYLYADESYDKIAASEKVTNVMNTMIFNYEHGTVASYLEISGQEVVPAFSTYPLKKEIVLEELPHLLTSTEIDYQTFHSCLNSFSSKSVVSILRHVDFGTGNYDIYVETTSGIKETLELLSSSRKAKYKILQLDEAGIVRGSGSKEYPVGTRFEYSADFGTVNENMYAITKSDFGFYNVLLLDSAAFFEEENSLLLNVIIILVSGLVGIIVILFMMYHFVFQPIEQLRKDIEDAGNGNLTPVSHVFYLDEFDQLFLQFNEMKNKVNILMQEVRKTEYERQQLEIDKLYYQINPHFLMNALNSLHWLAVAGKQKDIEEYVYQLNYILGYSLEKICKHSTFGTELKSLDMYLELQKKRYDFQVWKEIDMNEWLEYPCARLILQPLVENAICHNMNAFGNLWISMTCDGKKATIIIRDDGPGFKIISGNQILSERSNKGIGLRYVRMTLQSYYGDEATLKINSELNKGTTVTVEIPVVPEKLMGEENV